MKVSFSATKLLLVASLSLLVGTQGTAVIRLLNGNIHPAYPPDYEHTPSTLSSTTTPTLPSLVHSQHITELVQSLFSQAGKEVKSNDANAASFCDQARNHLQLLVHVRGPVTSVVRRAVEQAANTKITMYLPDNTFVVSTCHAHARGLASLHAVLWVGELSTHHKVDSLLAHAVRNAGAQGSLALPLSMFASTIELQVMMMLPLPSVSSSSAGSTNAFAATALQAFLDDELAAPSACAGARVLNQPALYEWMTAAMSAKADIASQRKVPVLRVAAPLSTLSSCLAYLAADPFVHYVDWTRTLRSHNDEARTVSQEGLGMDSWGTTELATHRLSNAGITGKGQILGMADKGIDEEHCLFSPIEEVVPPAPTPTPVPRETPTPSIPIEPTPVPLQPPTPDFRRRLLQTDDVPKVANVTQPVNGTNSTSSPVPVDGNQQPITPIPLPTHLSPDPAICLCNGTLASCVAKDALQPEICGQFNTKARKLANVWAFADNDMGDTHGSHVAGTAVGSPQLGMKSALAEYQGMAPDATLVFTDVGKGGSDGNPAGSNSPLVVPPFEDLFQWAYDLGARIHSDSYGGGPDNSYDLNAQSVDAFVHAHPDFLPIFSAGNDGGDAGGQIDPWGSLTNLANAKNALIVGASGNSKFHMVEELPVAVQTGMWQVVNDDLCATITYTLRSTGEAQTMCDKLRVRFEQYGGGLGFDCDQLRGALCAVVKDASGCCTLQTATDAASQTVNELLTQRNKQCCIQELVKEIDASIEKRPTEFFGVDGMWKKSSRGPTKDKRIRPDIVAPGAAVLSAWADGVCNEEDGIIAMSGTSFATPVVSGSALLVRQFYMDGFADCGIARPACGYKTPSAALVKAHLIAGATSLGPGVLQGESEKEFPRPAAWLSNLEGHGRIALHSSIRLKGEKMHHSYYDFADAKGLATGQVWNMSIPIDNVFSPLKIALVWTDPPSSPSAATTLVNDLDLVVETPTGQKIFGNGHYDSSSAEFKADSLNNAEVVVVDSRSLVKGVYTVTVRATNVPGGPAGSGEVEGGDAILQGFSVVIIHSQEDKFAYIEPGSSPLEQGELGKLYGECCPACAVDCGIRECGYVEGPPGCGRVQCGAPCGHHQECDQVAGLCREAFTVIEANELHELDGGWEGLAIWNHVFDSTAKSLCTIQEAEQEVDVEFDKQTDKGIFKFQPRSVPFQGNVYQLPATNFTTTVQGLEQGCMHVTGGWVDLRKNSDDRKTRIRADIPKLPSSGISGYIILEQDSLWDEEDQEYDLQPATIEVHVTYTPLGPEDVDHTGNFSWTIWSHLIDPSNVTYPLNCTFDEYGTMYQIAVPAGGAGQVAHAPTPAQGVDPVITDQDTPAPTPVNKGRPYYVGGNLSGKFGPISFPAPVDEIGGVLPAYIAGAPAGNQTFVDIADAHGRFLNIRDLIGHVLVVQPTAYTVSEINQVQYDDTLFESLGASCAPLWSNYTRKPPVAPIPIPGAAPTPYVPAPIDWVPAPDNNPFQPDRRRQLLQFGTPTPVPRPETKEEHLTHPFNTLPDGHDLYVYTRLYKGKSPAQDKLRISFCTGALALQYNNVPLEVKDGEGLKKPGAADQEEQKSEATDRMNADKTPGNTNQLQDSASFCPTVPLIHCVDTVEQGAGACTVVTLVRKLPKAVAAVVADEPEGFDLPTVMLIFAGAIIVCAFITYAIAVFFRKWWATRVDEYYKRLNTIQSDGRPVDSAGADGYSGKTVKTQSIKTMVTSPYAATRESTVDYMRGPSEESVIEHPSLGSSKDWMRKAGPQASVIHGDGLTMFGLAPTIGFDDVTPESSMIEQEAVSIFRKSLSEFKDKDTKAVELETFKSNARRNSKGGNKRGSDKMEEAFGQPMLANAKGAPMKLAPPREDPPDERPNYGAGLKKTPQVVKENGGTNQPNYGAGLKKTPTREDEEEDVLKVDHRAGLNAPAEPHPDNEGAVAGICNGCYGALLPLNKVCLKCDLINPFYGQPASSYTLPMSPMPLDWKPPNARRAVKDDAPDWRGGLKKGTVAEKEAAEEAEREALKQRENLRKTNNLAHLGSQPTPADGEDDDEAEIAFQRRLQEAEQKRLADLKPLEKTWNLGGPSSNNRQASISVVEEEPEWKKKHKEDLLRKTGRSPSVIRRERLAELEKKAETEHVVDFRGGLKPAKTRPLTGPQRPEEEVDDFVDFPSASVKNNWNAGAVPPKRVWKPSQDKGMPAQQLKTIFPVAENPNPTPAELLASKAGYKGKKWNVDTKAAKPVRWYAPGHVADAAHSEKLPDDEEAAVGVYIPNSLGVKKILSNIHSAVMDDLVNTVTTTALQSFRSGDITVGRQQDAYKNKMEARRQPSGDLVEEKKMELKKVVAKEERADKPEMSLSLANASSVKERLALLKAKNEEANVKLVDPFAKKK